MSRLSKKQLRSRWAELRDLLCEWDPIGVMGDPTWPRDEYDCLIGPVLSLLLKGGSDVDVANFLRNEITEHFGLNESYYDFEHIARRITSWFQNRGTEA
jgi:hypothetical protein